MYTIRKELGRLDTVRVALVGDLANGRTVRSLAYLLSKFEDVELVFVAPDVVRMGDDIKDFLTQRGVKWSESDDLMAVAASCDVLYQTRIQKERFVDRPQDYEKARGKYIITRQVMDALPKTGIVMHPLPRLDEITTEVDADPRAAATKTTPMMKTCTSRAHLTSEELTAQHRIALKASAAERRGFTRRRLLGRLLCR